MASPKLSLKLLVDTKVPRVLFAEAPKEFVDFLFHIFSLPIGTLLQLLGSNQVMGSLGKLKDSIESFNDNYLQPGIKTDDIFNPKAAFNPNSLFFDIHASSEDQYSGASKQVYRCANSTKICTCRQAVAFSLGYTNNKPCQSNAVTLDENTICPDCRCCMNVPTTVLLSKLVPVETTEKMKKGYVKEVVTYMVMDDLVVRPMSTISSITLLNKFGVKDLSQLEEKTVSFGKDEGLKLLEASLKTDKVLTNIFMH